MQWTSIKKDVIFFFNRKILIAIFSKILKGRVLKICNKHMFIVQILRIKQYLKRGKLTFMMSNPVYFLHYTTFLDCNFNWVQKVFFFIAVLTLYIHLLLLKE